MKLPYWQCLDCNFVFVPISNQDEFYFNCPNCDSSNTAPHIERTREEDPSNNEFYDLINNFKEYYISDPESIQAAIKPIIQRTGIHFDNETMLSYYMGLAHGYIQKHMEINKFTESDIEKIGADALVMLTDTIVEIMNMS